MKVKVHYISLVKSYTNKSQDEFNFPNDTATVGATRPNRPDLRQTIHAKKSTTQPKKR